VRRARISTTHATPEVAAVVAAALEPDNTDSMETRVDDETVVTTIERDTTGGLHSSVDDYVVNLAVADRLGRADGDGDGTDSTTAEWSDATAEREPNGRTARTDDQTDTTHDTHE
jgi:hypothetical protein